MSREFLPSIVFGSVLAYSPRPSDEEGERSREVCHRIKQDQFWKGKRLIPFAISRLQEVLTPELQDILAGDVVLVPAPRSAPFSPEQKNVLWVPERICKGLLEAGFGASMAPLLIRKTPVEKSAYMARGQRPSLEEHYRSMEVDPRVTPIGRITIVDDVVTKGSTLLAAATLLAQKFPTAEIRGFALIRTKGWSFEKILEPVCGRILHTKWGARREP